MLDAFPIRESMEQVGGARDLVLAREAARMLRAQLGLGEEKPEIPCHPLRVELGFPRRVGAAHAQHQSRWILVDQHMRLLGGSGAASSARRPEGRIDPQLLDEAHAGHAAPR